MDDTLERAMAVILDVLDEERLQNRNRRRTAEEDAAFANTRIDKLIDERNAANVMLAKVRNAIGADSILDALPLDVAVHGLVRANESQVARLTDDLDTYRRECARLQDALDKAQLTASITAHRAKRKA